MSRLDDKQIDAALTQLPQWQPPPGFSGRVAALAAARQRGAGSHWLPLVLQGMGVAAWVSVAAWLGAELLAGLLSAVPGIEGTLVWLLASGSLLLAWRLVRRPGLSRITS